MKIINKTSNATMTVCLISIGDKFEITMSTRINLVIKYWQYETLAEALKKYNELEEEIK